MEEIEGAWLSQAGREPPVGWGGVVRQGRKGELPWPGQEWGFPGGLGGGVGALESGCLGGLLSSHLMLQVT